MENQVTAAVVQDIDVITEGEGGRLKDEKVEVKPMRRSFIGNIDPFHHYDKNPNLHYCIVREMPAHTGLSNKQKFLNMGYTVASKLEGAEVYLMSLPKEDREADRQTSHALAKQQRLGGIEEIKNGQTEGAKNLFGKTSRNLTAEELQESISRLNG